MKDNKKLKISLFHRGRNFIKRVSDSRVLKHVAPLGVIPPELEDVLLIKPDVAKVLLDKALKDKSLSEMKIDFESDAFRQEMRKRAFIKNIKQKMSFFAGGIPTCKTLQDISVAKALNPTAQLPLSMDLYFGISMPAFIALHIVEHTLPPSPARKVV